MIGTLVNVAAVILGSLLGMAGVRGIPERMKQTIASGMALAVAAIGMSMAGGSGNMLIVLISLVVGGISGEAAGIEKGLERAGRFLEARFSGRSGDFGKGFMTATLIYCVGAMAIMGAIQDGLTGKRDILYAKSVLDGVTSIILSSTLGVGVMFSAVPVLLYQGGISLLASHVERVLTPVAVAELNATGGVLLVGIALNMLGVTRISVGNLLPAIVFAPVIVLAKGALGF